MVKSHSVPAVQVMRPAVANEQVLVPFLVMVAALVRLALVKYPVPSHWIYCNGYNARSFAPTLSSILFVDELNAVA